MRDDQTIRFEVYPFIDTFGTFKAFGLSFCDNKKLVADSLRQYLILNNGALPQT